MENLNLQLGFSHDVSYEIPKDVMERYQTSAYVCIHHDKTYKNEKAATQFVKQCDYCNSIKDMQQHIKPKKEKANAEG